MANLIGGYSMIDCTGLELTSESKLTISGIYNKVKTAYGANKPVYACNCTFGDKLATPLNVLVNPSPDDATKYVCTAATLQLTVDSSDGVTITNMAPSNRSAKSSK